MAAYTYTITCTAKPGANSNTAIGAFPTTTTPTVTRNEVKETTVYAFSAHDTITFIFAFGPGTPARTLNSATLYFIPLPGILPSIAAVTYRPMTTLASPILGQPSCIQITPNNNKIIINSSNSPMIGRWGFTMDIWDIAGNFYHLNDPEIQVGTGTPS